MKPRLAYAAGAYPGFRSMKRLGVFLLPLDGLLVHRRSLPRNFVRFPQQFTGTHLYTWVERRTARVRCLAQEHNTVSPARARTRTAQSGDERTNHEATAPPTSCLGVLIFCKATKVSCKDKKASCLFVFKSYCLNILESEGLALAFKLSGFSIVFSRRTTGFHRWAKLFKLNFFIRKTFP